VRNDTGLALVAVGALAVISFGAIQLGVDGAPNPTIAATTPDRPGVVDFKAGFRCTLPVSDVPPTSGFRVGGECTADLTDTTCTPREEDLYVSGAVVVDGAEKELVVTLLVPGFDGPGTYPNAQVVAQMTDSAIVPRWVGRPVTAQVDASGRVTVDSTTLEPEPGTPSQGTMAFSGSVVCEPE